MSLSEVQEMLTEVENLCEKSRHESRNNPGRRAK